MTVHCTFDSQSFECWQVGILLNFVGEMRISLSLRQIWRDWSRFSAPNRSFRGSERQQQHNNNIDNITCVSTRQTHQSSSSWQCYLTQKKLLFNRKTRYNYTLCSTVWKMSHLSLLGWKTQTTLKPLPPLARKQEQGIWPPVVFFENLFMHSSSCHLIGSTGGDTHHSPPWDSNDIQL